MTMTADEARKLDWPSIEIGQSYEFYAEMQQEYEPVENRMRNYTSQQVKVLRLCGEDENDPENSPLYEVEASDGKHFFAHEEELTGWDKALGQFFWPDGTHGPDHDKTFLVNEISAAEVLQGREGVKP